MKELHIRDGPTVQQVERYTWGIPPRGDMRVPGHIYIDTPGILCVSLAMADVRPGYGFPIGGVGAFDLHEGVVTLAGTARGASSRANKLPSSSRGGNHHPRAGRTWHIGARPLTPRGR